MDHLAEVWSDSPPGARTRPPNSVVGSGGSSAASVTSTRTACSPGWNVIPRCRLSNSARSSGWSSTSRPGIHALWISAKGAVDNDLVQSALEEGELLIIEPGDEQLRDPADMDGRGLS